MHEAAQTFINNIYVHMCICICMNVHIQEAAQAHLHLHTHIHISSNASTSTSTYTYMQPRKHKHIHIHIHSSSKASIPTAHTLRPSTGVGAQHRSCWHHHNLIGCNLLSVRLLLLPRSHVECAYMCPFVCPYMCAGDASPAGTTHLV